MSDHKLARLKDQLRRQRAFLEGSCHLYDGGNLEEAIRIATTLRVLLHDARKSVSLLTLLGSPNINLLDTCHEQRADIYANPFSVLGPFPIVLPMLNRASESHCFVPRSEWWEMAVYVNHGHFVKRRDMILWATNKDGGAHVDPDLPAGYEAFMRGAPVSVTAADGRVFRLVNEHVVGLRQFGYEVLNSPELWALAD